MAKTAITPTRKENFPEWYQQVVKSADLAENSSVRGCMVIKPWGFGIWERMQRQLDDRIKATGHENAYFPLFIPLSFFQKEAEHVEGFATECAVVTHHRLEEQQGSLQPASPLEEPLVVRPTSETIIGHSFAKWIQSYRDLPLLINQWANVVRWEMRPRVFLRTSEFLWQEGHTAHATEKEAREETTRMLQMYQSFAEDVLAVPVFVGEKSPDERFPGADDTYCIEAIMQDGKALQAGTSHYLGQNFSRASEITFNDVDGQVKHVYTSSWGVSTRLMGAVIMTHSDDDGLCLPPRIAAKEVVIIPVIPKEETRDAVMSYAESIAEELREKQYHGKNLTVVIDDRDIRGGEKTWEWIKKGIPIRLEVGPRDLPENNVMLARRDTPAKQKEKVHRESVADHVIELLDVMQKGYFTRAKAYREKLCREVNTWQELQEVLCSDQGFFARAKWCAEEGTEAKLSELKASIRCILQEQSNEQGTCVITGKPATLDVIIAKAY